MEGAAPLVEMAELNSEVRSLHARIVEHNSEDRERFEKIDKRISSLQTSVNGIERREARVYGASKVIIALLVIVAGGIVPASIYFMRNTVTSVLLEHGVIRITTGR